MDSSSKSVTFVFRPDVWSKAAKYGLSKYRQKWIIFYDEEDPNFFKAFKHAHKL
jgi:hypothetical protein